MLDTLLKLDGDILLWLQENVRNTILTPIMKFVTTIGNGGMIWIVFALILLAWKKYRLTGAAAAMTLISNLVVINLIVKNLVDRTRPYAMIENLTILVSKPSDSSFPSGHAGHAFGVAIVIFLMMPKKYGIPALILAALISFSRLYVGVHYPTDVLAGIVIGSLMGFLCVKLVNALSASHADDSVEKA